MPTSGGQWLEIGPSMPAYSCRFLSARCSNGDYLGSFARPDRPPSEPLAPSVAHNSSGFTVMDGSSDTFLEEFGNVTQPVDASDEFHDACPIGDLIIGYQITYSSGSGILQLRFLCSSPSNSSNCGALTLSRVAEF